MIEMGHLLHHPRTQGVVMIKLVPTEAMELEIIARLEDMAI